MNAAERHDLLEHGRTARRVRWLVVTVGALTVLGLAATWIATGGISPDAFVLWLGLAALVTVLGAMAIVALAALRGMLRAGDRGERLADRDVGLIPPQLRSRDEGRSS